MRETNVAHVQAVIGTNAVPFKYFIGSPIVFCVEAQKMLIGFFSGITGAAALTENMLLLC